MKPKEIGCDYLQMVGSLLVFLTTLKIDFSSQKEALLCTHNKDLIDASIDFSSFLGQFSSYYCHFVLQKRGRPAQITHGFAQSNYSTIHSETRCSAAQDRGFLQNPFTYSAPVCL